MKKIFRFGTLLLMINYNNLTAQQIDSVMNVYAEQFAPEKLHLQIDRSEYNEGETIYYKAYLLEDHYPSSLSKNIYVDWYDDAGNLIKQTEAPLLLFGAKGSFDVPKNYKGKFVYLKAYSKWMLNFDTALIYTRSIAVSHPAVKKEGAYPSTVQASHSTYIELYPEGGFSIAGLTNRFAFKAVDQSGNPVCIKATIKNNKNVLIDSVRALHDGMGIFSLQIKKDETYSFNWVDDKGNIGISEFGAQKQSGAVLKVILSNKKAWFTIQRSLNAGSEFKTMHLFVHRNYFLRYKIDINMLASESISSEIVLDDMPSGIVQFTLFNDDWLPVAERIIFVNNQNYSFYPKVLLPKKNLSKRGLNDIEIIVPDTLVTNMSVAITDAGFSNTGGPTIFSDLLLSDDIRGKVNNAAYYFSNDARSDLLAEKDKLTDSVLAANLDLVMLTYGHRRYDWEQITKGKMPAISYPADTSYLEIKGQAIVKKAGKLKEPLFINVMLQGTDGVKKTFVLPVNKEGLFERKNLFYYDTTKLFYNLSAKNANGVVKFENSMMAGEERKKYFKNFLPANCIMITNSPQDKNKALTGDSSFYILQNKERDSKKVNVLQDVIVTSKAKTQKQILDDYYTSGMYSGDNNNYAIDVEGDITSSRYRDVFAYLQTKVPGLNVEYTSSQPIPLWYPNSQGIRGTPAFLLDEAPISLESVGAIDISSISYVKAFKPPFLGSMLNGFSGVIALYSKRGYSPIYHNENNVSGLEQALLLGYTKFKEFTQPEYFDHSSIDQKDLRPTLYWNPFIITDKNNPRFTIDFYNNDISKKVCIIIEGINTEGKMTRIVKVIE